MAPEEEPRQSVWDMVEEYRILYGLEGANVRGILGNAREEARTYNVDPERPKSRQERRADARRKAKELRKCQNR